MSLDNAAQEILESPEVTDEFVAMSDRELMEYIARNMAATIAIAEGVHAQVAPIMEKLGKHPLLGGLFR